MSRPLVAPAAGHPSITASTHSDGTIQHDTPFPVNNSSKLAHPTDPVEQLYHSTVNEAPFSNNSHQIIIISHPNPQEQPSRNAPSALLRIIYGDSIAAGAAPFAINEPPTQSPLPTPANMDLDVDYDADDEASPSDGDRNEDDLSEFEFPDSLFPAASPSPVQMAAVILLVGQHVDDELYPELEVERLMGWIPKGS
ncbi:hypothetical protein N0V88_000808 [Collariella sp. IMI 366227]|nr:hypothetical protein N0V88_000808 [Collariella sp. IMI 366227]